MKAPMKIYCVRHWFPALLLSSPDRKTPQECDAVYQLSQSDSRCWRYVSVLSNFTPWYLASEQKVRISSLKLTFSSRLAFLLLRWRTADTVFVVLSVTFQTWNYLFTYNLHGFAEHFFHLGIYQGIN